MMSGAAVCASTAEELFRARVLYFIAISFLNTRVTIRDGDAACIMDWRAEATRVPAQDLAVAASQLLEGKQHADLEHAVSGLGPHCRAAFPPRIRPIGLL